MEKIKVVLRMRPFSKEEKKEKCKESWNLDLESNQISSKIESNYKTTYRFDQIFTPKNSNQKVYTECSKEIVIRALDGIDTTIFVYGQTGAGKTHTMLGNRINKNNFDGLIFKGLQDIFKEDENEEDTILKLTCSYLEIYNEGIYDLLTKKEEDIGKELTIFEDAANNKFIVKNETRKNIKSMKDVIKYLKFGEKNRNYAETYFNHKSSRSHTIFAVQIENEKIIKGETAFVKTSTINFVDLAGSERLLYEQKQRKSKDKTKSRNASPINRKSRTPIKKDRFKESKHINKSLFYLTQVIKLVSQKNVKHIPFRNSPLTKILRSSFGGHSRTLLILCTAPAEIDFDITLSTLRFGRCAKLIENKVKTNIRTDFSQNAFDAIISSYEKKVSHFYDRLGKLENENKNHLSLGKDLKKFKEMLADRYLKFHQNSQYKVDLIKRNKKLGNKFEFLDFIFRNVGILYGKKKIDKKKENFCHFCNNNLKILLHKKPKDDKNYQKNKDKLWKDVDKVEKTIKDFLQNSGIDFNFISNNIIKVSDIYHDFIIKLLKIIHQLRNNLTLYTNEERIRSLENSDLQEMEEEIKRVWDVYYEEKTIRKVKKKYEINASFCDSSVFDNLVKEEEKNFVKIKQEVELSIEEFEKSFKDAEKKKLENINLLDNMKKGINKFLNNSDKERTNILNSFYKIKNEYKKEVYLNEKRFNWFIKQQKENEEFLKNGKKSEENLLNSSKSLSHLMKKNFIYDKDFFKNKEMLFYYSMINKKFKTLSSVTNKIKKLRRGGKDSLVNDEILNQITGKKELINLKKKKSEKSFKKHKNKSKNPSKKNKSNKSKSKIKKLKNQNSTSSIKIIITEDQDIIVPKEKNPRKSKISDNNTFINEKDDEEDSMFLNPDSVSTLKDNSNKKLPIVNIQSKTFKLSKRIKRRRDRDKK